MDKSFSQIKNVFINELAFTPRKIAVSVTFVFFCLLWAFAFKGLIELDEFFKDDNSEKGFFLGFLMWVLDLDPLQLDQIEETGVFFVSFGILSLLTTHFFVILMTSDQTASEIGNRYFRYLVTRCGRTEIFIGRLLSALTISFFAIALTGIAAFGADCYLKNGTTSFDSVFYVVNTCLWVFLFCLPFVSLCSMISAWSGSVATSMLCSMSLAFLLPKVFNVIELKWKQVEGIKDIRDYFPGNFTHSVLLDNANAINVIVPLAYAVAFAWIGCSIFRRREFP
jgi:ABC-type transport system involved in multi-copper enzyme maturation permease subunit